VCLCTLIICNVTVCVCEREIGFHVLYISCLEEAMVQHFIICEHG